MSQELQEQLRSVLDYDPATGIFTWRVTRRGKVAIGDVAGGLTPKGYRYIPFNGKMVGAHRLAWLYVYGVLPDCDIDHRNRNRDDNWIDNLRLSTRSQNMSNSVRKRTPSSPYQGVCWDKESQRWLACVTVNYKQIHLGRFDSPELAHGAYVEASRKHHGQFAAY